MPDRSADAAGRGEVLSLGGNESNDAAMACLACGLITVGVIGAAIGLMRRPGDRRPWPALRTPTPPDFTPPHGDKLSGHY